MEIDKKISPAPKPNPPATFTIDQVPKKRQPSWLDRHMGVSVLIIVVCLGGSIFVMTKNWDTGPRVIPVIDLVDNKPQTSNSPDKFSTLNTYTNSDHGFQITVTNAWKGYKVFLTHGQDGTDYYQFAMPTTDKTKCLLDGPTQVCGYASIIILNLSNSTQTKPGFIAQKSGVTYSYLAGVNLPKDLASTNFDIPKVVSTFTFTK